MSTLLSVAPMLDCTDKHERFFLRLISRHAELYTEMLVAKVLQYRQPARWLDYNQAEHPVVLQLAGDNPETLAFATKLANDWGYDGVNLNVGCPSEKVTAGHFGACLFLEPKLVAECVAAMCAISNIPITIKTRIGVDTQDEYSHLDEFIALTALAGCSTFVLHARKAWLTGLNPAQNRSLPPLRYPIVYQLKQDYPQLKIIINGGLNSVSHAWNTCQESHPSLDGAMMGRAVYANPYLLAEADQIFYQDDHPILTIFELLDSFLSYLHTANVQGGELRAVTRHLQGLFQGQPGAKAWRKLLGDVRDLDALRTAVHTLQRLHAHTSGELHTQP